MFEYRPKLPARELKRLRGLFLCSITTGKTIGRSTLLSKVFTETKIPVTKLAPTLISGGLAYTPRGVYTTTMKHVDDKSKVKIIRRLKLIEGQVRGLQKMIENDTYCIDVITQTSAVKQGLSNVEDLLLENHLGGCILNQIKSGKTDQAKQEILKVYKLKRK